MDIHSIKKAIDIETETGQLMAKIVVSSYRKGEPMNLYELIRLDSQNFKLAVQVMSYRRCPGWSDDEFLKLERYAAQRLAMGYSAVSK